jgi:AcrR family transcriptional regulator
MVRGAGISTDRVVEASAEIADEHGYDAVTLAAVAQRLGIRAPSLYNHVESLADLQQRLATLAMTELGERIRDAMLGLAGRDALAALASVTRAYVAEHPGRYAATIGAPLGGPGDPLVQASSRVVDAIAAVLRGYSIPDSEMVHAIRTIRCALHGYAALEATDAFQWSEGSEQSLAWMIDLIDRGLTR